MDTDESASARPPARRRGRSPALTRKRLVDAAERLFAERGIDEVTLLEITHAAGQLNRAALQYHFGDKAGLIRAVFERHTGEIAAHRERMLDALGARGEYGLRDVVESFVTPVAEHCHERGESYLHINSQLMASRRWSGFRLQLGDISAVTVRMRRMLAGRLPSLPKRELDTRMLLIDVMLFHGLATYASRATKPGWRYFTVSLVDAITAVLARPPDRDD